MMLRRRFLADTGAGLAVVAGHRLLEAADAALGQLFPARAWTTSRPHEVGLDRVKLDALRDLIGGRGCVIRHGYLAYSWGDLARSADVASAMKPVLSTLLLLAVQEGRLPSVDALVSESEPRLASLNNGKDKAITWRHLASQLSGYGLAEPPGRAYAYNDYALALYYDVLFQKVFKDDGTEVLRRLLGGPLQFEDPFTFEAFGPSDRPGRLAVSVRDFARFGLLYLHQGKWLDRQVLRSDLCRLALSSPVPPDIALTTGRDRDMLPRQRTIGGAKNITTIGPGYYSFNWWLNGSDRLGRRLYPTAPDDTYVANGHGGPRMLWIIPSLDLVASWNDAAVEDHDACPGNAQTKLCLAARLLCEAVVERPGAAKFAPRTQVTIHNERWLINQTPTYPGARAQGLLMNARMVNAVFEDRRRPNFDAAANTARFLAQVPAYAAHGIRAFTLCLQGGFPGYEGAQNSAFESDGSLRSAYLDRIGRVIEACDRQGVAVILGCYYQRQDQLLKDEAAVRAGVVNVATWLRRIAFGNVLLEIANEFPHAGFDHPILRRASGQVELWRLAKKSHPGLLVSTSAIGDGHLAVEVAAASDFLLIHLNGVALSAIPGRVAPLCKLGKPIVCNENDKFGAQAAKAAELSVSHGASWGLMLEKHNQHFPFRFDGPDDDAVVYARLKKLTEP